MNRYQLAIQSDAILYLSGEGNYTHIYFTEGTRQIYAKTLGEFARELPTFIRIHKSHLVNPSHMVEFKTTKGGGGVVRVGTEWLTVSRRRINEVKPLFTRKTLTKGNWYSVEPGIGKN